jgi:phage head-tail adaptor, putative, SPP1 family
MISANRLNERINVIRATEEELPDGSIKKTWMTLHSPFCEVEEKDASIDVIASQENIGQVAIFTMRYNPEVFYQIGDRIKWRSREFKIHSFKVDSLRTKTVIIAKMHNETTEM